MQWPDMTPIVAPIQWAVIDAVATRQYMPERMTQDFDIAIAVADAEQTRRRLATAGLVKLGDLSIGGSSWQTPDGIRIDVIEIDRVRSVFQRYASDDLEDLESLITLGRMETGRFNE